MKQRKRDMEDSEGKRLGEGRRWEVRRRRRVMEAMRKGGRAGAQWTAVEGPAVKCKKRADQWYVKRRKKRVKVNIASGAAVQLASGADNGEQIGREIMRTDSGVCELEWDGLDQRYVKKRRKKIEGGPVNGASTEVELAIGASAETRRQVGCDLANVMACSAELRSVRGGRASEELWAVLEQGVEPIGRESKEREGNEGKEENNKKERDVRGDVGWTENNSISVKESASVCVRVNREIEVEGNVVYWEVKGG